MSTLGPLLCAALACACDGGSDPEATDAGRPDAGRPDAGPVPPSMDAGGPSLFADIQYGIDCTETGGCVAQPDRDICGIHLGEACAEVEGETVISCTVTQTGDVRSLTFSASQGLGYAISIREAEIPVAGGSAEGAACAARVIDGPNTFQGACGSAPPSESQPCQISDVRWYDDAGNPTVEGRIFCQNLPNQANPAVQLALHAKGSDSMATMTPGSFRLANCDGLEL